MMPAPGHYIVLYQSTTAQSYNILSYNCVFKGLEYIVIFILHSGTSNLFKLTSKSLGASNITKLHPVMHSGLKTVPKTNGTGL